MKSKELTVYAYAESVVTIIAAIYELKSGDTANFGLRFAAVTPVPADGENPTASLAFPDLSAPEFACDDDMYDEIYRSVYNLVYLFIVSLWLDD